MSDMLVEATSATTLLDAVNVCLKTIGEAPAVTLIEGGGSVDVESAFNTIQEISRQVQGLGWHFNKEIRLKLTPDPEGQILLPENTLRVDECYPEDRMYGSDMVQRGLRLWDRLNHTFKHNRPVFVDLVVLLPFEQLPQYARTYITIKSARKFAQDETNSESTSKFTLQDEEKAEIEMEQMDQDNAGHNMAIHSPFIRTMRRR